VAASFFNKGGSRYEETNVGISGGRRSIRDARCGAGPIELQGLRRPAKGVREELRRSDLQDGLSDVHEVLQEEEVVRPPAPLDRIGAVAESAQKSSPAREAREEELFDLLDRQCKSGVPAPCRDSLREYLCNAAQRSCNHGVSE